MSYSGYLYKILHGTFYHKLYCVLIHENKLLLCYGENPNENFNILPEFVIDLASVELAGSLHSATKYFTLVSCDGFLVRFGCTTEGTRNEWVQAIQACLCKEFQSDDFLICASSERKQILFSDDVCSTEYLTKLHLSTVELRSPLKPTSFTRDTDHRTSTNHENFLSISTSQSNTNLPTKENSEALTTPPKVLNNQTVDSHNNISKKSSNNQNNSSLLEQLLLNEIQFKEDHSFLSETEIEPTLLSFDELDLSFHETQNVDYNNNSNINNITSSNGNNNPDNNIIDNATTPTTATTNNNVNNNYSHDIIINEKIDIDENNDYLYQIFSKLLESTFTKIYQKSTASIDTHTHQNYSNPSGSNIYDTSQNTGISSSDADKISGKISCGVNTDVTNAAIDANIDSVPVHSVDVRRSSSGDGEVKEEEDHKLPQSPITSHCDDDSHNYNENKSGIYITTNNNDSNSKNDNNKNNTSNNNKINNHSNREYLLSTYHPTSNHPPPFNSNSSSLDSNSKKRSVSFSNRNVKTETPQPISISTSSTYQKHVSSSNTSLHSKELLVAAARQESLNRKLMYVTSPNNERKKHTSIPITAAPVPASSPFQRNTPIYQLTPNHKCTPSISHRRDQPQPQSRAYRTDHSPRQFDLTGSLDGLSFIMQSTPRCPTPLSTSPVWTPRSSTGKTYGSIAANRCRVRELSSSSSTAAAAACYSKGGLSVQGKDESPAPLHEKHTQASYAKTNMRPQAPPRPQFPAARTPAKSPILVAVKLDGVATPSRDDCDSNHHKHTVILSPDGEHPATNPDYDLLDHRGGDVSDRRGFFEIYANRLAQSAKEKPHTIKKAVPLSVIAGINPDVKTSGDRGTL